jgi:hypothetical protein
MIKLPVIKRIFIDLDDTLVDFMGELHKLLYGPEKNPTQEELIVVDRKLRDEPEFVDKMWDLIGNAGPQWYAGLPKLSWCDDLLNAARKACPDVCILTSPGSREQAVVACQGKIMWSLKEFGKNDIILAKRKYLCASEGFLLIDDNPFFLDKWEAYGGFPVHLKRWFDDGFTPDEIIESLLNYSNH